MLCHSDDAGVPVTVVGAKKDGDERSVPIISQMQALINAFS
jgi:hypothetical protein